MHFTKCSSNTGGLSHQCKQCVQIYTNTDDRRNRNRTSKARNRTKPSTFNSLTSR